MYLQNLTLLLKEQGVFTTENNEVLKSEMMQLIRIQMLEDKLCTSA